MYAAFASILFVCLLLAILVMAADYNWLESAFRRVFKHDHYGCEYWAPDQIAGILNHEYRMEDRLQVSETTVKQLFSSKRFQSRINLAADMNPDCIHIRSWKERSGRQFRVAYVATGSIGDPEDFEGSYSTSTRHCDITEEEKADFFFAHSDFVLAKQTEKTRKKVKSLAKPPSKKAKLDEKGQTAARKKHEEAQAKLKEERRDALSVTHFGSRQNHKDILDKLTNSIRTVDGWTEMVVGADDKELRSLITASDGVAIGYNLTAIRMVVFEAWENPDDLSWKGVMEKVIKRTSGSIGKINSLRTLQRRFSLFSDYGFKFPHPCMFVDSDGEEKIGEKEVYCLLNELYIAICDDKEKLQPGAHRTARGKHREHQRVRGCFVS